MQDTRPGAFKEELALNRHRANFAFIAGHKVAENQIQQNVANSTAVLQQSGTEASGVLAGLSRLNQNAPSH